MTDPFVRHLQNTIDKIKLDRGMEERYMLLEEMMRNEKQKGINVSNNMRKKILESYLNLFSTLEEAIETECKRE